ncbi:hypothetical protein D4739_15450 [Nocardioides cavernaquae]|uniref:Uncharacterized protein n=1 Tax=Nocardioides cavernaquae TaxID=2321396 RepID=A0A3A5HA08_9ACTN|nr:hypothetical protein D4739_15450 [Nocardioides cavernaquae]
MSEALDDPVALRLVFDWIDRLLGADDDMIDYWTHAHECGLGTARRGVRRPASQAGMGKVAKAI